MMKKILWMLGGVVLTVTVAEVGYFAWAGSIDSSQVPDNVASRMYTLENIYGYLTSVDSAAPTKSVSATFVEPSAPPGPTMHTLDEIFANLQRFPATGQTTSYGTAADDGDYQAGATLRYTDNGDNTITDVNTGLMWDKCSIGQSTSDCGAGSPTTFNWEDAASECEGLSLGGEEDWRLPNVKELVSIIDYGVTGGGARINETYFPDTAIYTYWTSTSASDTSRALIVSFSGGTIETLARTSADPKCRCVRGGQ